MVLIEGIFRFLFLLVEIFVSKNQLILKILLGMNKQNEREMLNNGQKLCVICPKNRSRQGIVFRSVDVMNR